MSVVHTSASINDDKAFHQNILDSIKNLQDQQQTVEVQYSFSNAIFSALILGYIIE